MGKPPGSKNKKTLERLGRASGSSSIGVEVDPHVPFDELGPVGTAPIPQAENATNLENDLDDPNLDSFRELLPTPLLTAPQNDLAGLSQSLSNASAGLDAVEDGTAAQHARCSRPPEDLQLTPMSASLSLDALLEGGAFATPWGGHLEGDGTGLQTTYDEAIPVLPRANMTSTQLPNICFSPAKRHSYPVLDIIFWLLVRPNETFLP